MMNPLHQGPTRSIREFGVGFAGIIALVIGERTPLFLIPTGAKNQACRHNTTQQKRCFHRFHRHRHFYVTATFIKKLRSQKQNAASKTVETDEPALLRPRAGRTTPPAPEPHSGHALSTTALDLIRRSPAPGAGSEATGDDTLAIDIRYLIAVTGQQRLGRTHFRA
ncbi:MAG: hypothetical protein ACI9MJ_000432 [Alphaproteobacteria bacterium]|jgi:hypothetical protein